MKNDTNKHVLTNRTCVFLYLLSVAITSFVYNLKECASAHLQVLFSQESHHRIQPTFRQTPAIIDKCM